MCVSMQSCTEIPNRAAMDPLAPLPLPWQLIAALGLLHDGIRLAAEGNVSKARQLLQRYPEVEARQWGVKHGQVSGRSRWRLLDKPLPPRAVGPLSNDRAVSAVLARKIYERDGFRCRYCGLPVIPREVLRATTLVVGSAAFGTGKPNEENHGGALLSWAQVDHVVPWNLGGSTDLQNLVTSCWACNYGKHNYALEQIGVADPRERLPSEPTESWRRWDGLTSLLEDLRGQQ
jgi:5-methylcytosine-specific restriction endonuclease McrA